MDLRPYSKAIAGTILGALTVFLTKYNIVIDDSLNNALEILIGAIVVGAGVYLSPPNSPLPKVLGTRDRG